MEDIEEFKLKCLSAIPIRINDDIFIIPKPLKKIIEIGYANYNSMMSVVLIDETELGMSVYHYLKKLCFESEENRNYILSSLQYFINVEVAVNSEGFAYSIKENDFKYISEDDFNKLIKVIKIQNCFFKFDDEENEFNPSSEKARQIIEKTLKNRKRIQELKDEDDDNERMTLFDLVSVVATNCNGLNILNIWELTFFQLNNQFNRMALLENYKVNIRAMLAGAEKVEIQNWMSKL